MFFFFFPEWTAYHAMAMAMAMNRVADTRTTMIGVGSACSPVAWGPWAYCLMNTNVKPGRWLETQKAQVLMTTEGKTQVHNFLEDREDTCPASQWLWTYGFLPSVGGRIEVTWTPKFSTPLVTAILQDFFYLRKSWTCEHHLQWGPESILPWNQGAMDVVFLSKPARRGSCSSLNQRTMTSLESGRRGRSQVLQGRKRVRKGMNQRRGKKEGEE